MLSHYAEMAAAAGLVSVIASNASPWVAPHGATEAEAAGQRHLGMDDRRGADVPDHRLAVAREAEADRSHYAEMAAAAGLVSVIASNASPWVAPHGATEGRFGTGAHDRDAARRRLVDRDRRGPVRHEVAELVAALDPGRGRGGADRRPPARLRAARGRLWRARPGDLDRRAVVARCATR
jgi:hypothetical protein